MKATPPSNPRDSRTKRLSEMRGGFKIDSLQKENEARDLINTARNLRKKYSYRRLFEPWETGQNNFDFSIEYSYDFNKDGIFEIYKDADKSSNIFPVPSLNEYIKDHKLCESIVQEKTVKSIGAHRLKTIDHLFSMHCHFNWKNEEVDSFKLDTSDFYSIAKVDTHIHLSAAISPKDLLDYIKQELRNNPDEIVLNGKSLVQICNEANVTLGNISLDRLNCQADPSVFDRFDLFNSKYKLAGSTDLKEVFLNFINDCKGRHLANLTRIAHDRLRECDHLFSEWRISIVGASISEWGLLADFMVDNNLYNLSNNKWMVQNPRIYRNCKLGNWSNISNYANMIENFFRPLFEATIYPERPENVKLALFLKHLSGFDSVDDESTPDPELTGVNPNDWNGPGNPNYAYQLYFFWANIFVLNRVRESMGLNVFLFRPHCGESGDVMHLVTGYLLSNGIAHGINLQRSLSLQYLYYIDKIGLHFSPSSNNFLFLKFKNSPFETFFKRGLNVSLSTDDPLIFHLSNHPLLEEYSICRVFWSMSQTDCSEVAQNSVLQSGFDHDWKLKWMGPNYYKSGPDANFPSHSNIPMIRSYFRYEIYQTELGYLNGTENYEDDAQEVIGVLNKLDSQAFSFSWDENLQANSLKNN